MIIAMNEVEFFDISNFNCWMINIMPFGPKSRTDYYLVNNLQQECVRLGIFGMGCGIPCFEYFAPMTDENIDLYVKTYRDRVGDKRSMFEDTLKRYKSIKKGDYLVMKIKNGHLYVGCVSSDGAKYIYKEDDPVYKYFSWGGTVEKWFEYSSEQEIPSEIVRRYSQRFHSTIQRIIPYRQRLLVISMYERKSGDRIFNVPQLRIGLNNFVRSLSYMQLEDLVALYIMNKHSTEGYKLMPSSCKLSQQNYEFSFVKKENKPNKNKIITCQVKNQEDVIIDHYINEDSYEIIYIFSGKWSEEEVIAKREQYKNYSHIYIIAPSELYMTLKEEKELFENDFYIFENAV